MHEFTDARSMYQGRHAVLLTQHGKEAIIGPVLQAAIGCHVNLVGGFDTDQLGTFTRDIPRTGSQRETAIKKARIGMRLADSRLGLASEGAFVADPYTGLMPWNVELVVFIDDDKGLELTGMAQGPAKSGHRAVNNWKEVVTFAEEAEFPSHHLVLMPNDEHDSRSCKGISDWTALQKAYDHAVSLSSKGVVVVENDLRAYCNPTRQKIIASATDNLAQKLGSSCPVCAAPGYWMTRTVTGLPCAICARATRQPLADTWSCWHCGHGEEKRRPNVRYADPSQCDRCNP
ncbi:DUF6671 family protein [Polaromonas sp.]|uniref:DUF6671 family protein n=1 Tax=Polaromonas sp. TaxID=1869339 RepID=UPI0013B98E2C|nr:DUF6671 family protein [Polaromonas sp.]NDP62164.1 hypothetical protein [Polaromonas sp.]